MFAKTGRGDRGISNHPISMEFDIFFHLISSFAVLGADLYITSFPEQTVSMEEVH